MLQFNAQGCPAIELHSTPMTFARQSRRAGNSIAVCDSDERQVL